MTTNSDWYRNSIFLAIGAALLALTTVAQAETLRLLTWSDYAPEDIIAEFEEATGISVEVTLSNNEDMISKLRATGGAGFDLAQPSQDRIVGAQRQFRIYKPIDMSQIDTGQITPSMLDATRESTTLDGEVYGVPHIWGTSGLILHDAARDTVKDYVDLCDDSVAGRVSYRLARPTLIGFAFSMGEDPFAAYDDEATYQAILDKVEEKLIECKPNVKTYWTGSDQLLSLVQTGEVTAAMGWDAGGWKLNAENPEVNFIAPASGALGWIDTFVLPARGENDEAAYQWINFVMQPEIAARITAASSYFTASAGSEELVSEEQRDAFAESFGDTGVDNIKWYPPVPAGLETLEGQTLDRVQAAN